MTDTRENDEHNLSLQLGRLNVLLAQVNADESVPELMEIIERIRELWSSAKNYHEKTTCIDCASILSVTFLRDMLLMDFATEAYRAKDYALAFYGFTKGAQVGNSSAKNNLAYMIRRNEYSYGEQDNAETALRLLLPGLRRKEPFSIVNAALVLCLLLGEEQDWRTADTLLSYISGDEQSISDWWSSIGDDIEGYLVHFFLLRHKKITHSHFGSLSSIVLKLKENVEGLPEWIIENY